MIPITRPCIGEEEAQAAAKAVLSGWLSQGERVQEFESLVAGYVGAKHAIATSNCTTALQLALIGAGVGPGDEEICPSFSFIATANAILHAGATPVFVDIDPDSYNIAPELIGAAITPRTKAIMPVDQIGLAADIPAVLSIAARYGLVVIEDAAPSLGSRVGEGRVGAMADFTCFSFHPRKSITTGEGGMVTTNDDEGAERIRRLRSHGASTSDLARHKSGTTAIEEYPELGYNYRMTDIQGAIGSVQMGRLESIIGRRRALAAQYNALLADERLVTTPHEPAGHRHTYQSYCLRLDRSVERAGVMEAMAADGVSTRRGVMAIHLEPFYRAMDPALSLPVTEAATAETLLLPLFADMTDGEQDIVVASLRAALRRA